MGGGSLCWQQSLPWSANRCHGCRKLNLSNLHPCHVCAGSSESGGTELPTWHLPCTHMAVTRRHSTYTEEYTLHYHTAGSCSYSEHHCMAHMGTQHAYVYPQCTVPVPLTAHILSREWTQQKKTNRELTSLIHSSIHVWMRPIPACIRLKWSFLNKTFSKE